MTYVTIGGVVRKLASVNGCRNARRRGLDRERLPGGEEREIGAGNEISLVAEDRRKVRVRETMLLLYREPIDAEGIGPALRIEGLAGDLRGELEELPAAGG
jgi:hypothetical protein